MRQRQINKKERIEELGVKNSSAASRRRELRNLGEEIDRTRQVKGSKDTADVFILTYCRTPELLYGSTLIFSTLRLGFPNANIVVIDNASLPEARAEIERLAKESECHFEQIPAPGVHHHEFIQHTLATMADGNASGRPLVFLDPDICLWKNCEDFNFDGLIAGKLIMGFDDHMTQTVTMPRLHSSFLWIPDAERLQRIIRKIKIKRFDFEPFASYSIALDGKWYRYDTGASLYAAIPGRSSCFTEEHLNCYDHLTAGCHVDLLDSLYEPSVRAMMADIHKNAKAGNLHALRGMWKNQRAVWRESLRRQNHH